MACACAGFYKLQKGALDSQPQVIKFNSCLSTVGGSLRVAMVGYKIHMAMQSVDITTNVASSNPDHEPDTLKACFLILYH